MSAAPNAHAGLYSPPMPRSLLLLPLLASPLTAQSLDIGSPAPVVAPSKWVHGEPVDFAKHAGRVLVLTFWVTWIPEAKRAIPYLSGLQTRLRERGVVVAAVALRDEHCTQTKVENFVTDRRAELHLAMGWDGADALGKAWLDAAHQEDLPCTFVVDTQGKIAWIGSPHDSLEPVLTALLAGTYDLEKARKWRAAERELEQALTRKLGWDAVLAAADKLIDLEPKNPRGWMARLYTVGVEQKQKQQLAESGAKALAALHDDAEALRMLAQFLCSEPVAAAGKDLALAAIERMIALQPEEAGNHLIRFDVLWRFQRNQAAAGKAGDEAIAKAKDAATLTAFAWTLLNEKESKETWKQLALTAAEKARTLPGGEHYTCLDTLALAHFENGRRDAAITLQKQALAHCEDAEARKELQQRLDRFQAAGREKK